MVMQSNFYAGYPWSYPLSLFKVLGFVNILKIGLLVVMRTCTRWKGTNFVFMNRKQIQKAVLNHTAEKNTTLNIIDVFGLLKHLK